MKKGFVFTVLAAFVIGLASCSHTAFGHRRHNSNWGAQIDNRIEKGSFCSHSVINNMKPV